MDTESATDELRPPYLPFATFLGFLSELASKPLPPQIDRSMMSSKSGTDQANLFSALKFFNLIDGQQVVQDGLKALVATDDEGRKRALGSMFRQRYPGQFKVSEQNGTEKALLDSFEHDFGYSGDTRRKAMTFFLHGARWADTELSAHFPATRLGSGRSPGPRPKRAVKKKTASLVTPERSATGNLAGDGEKVHVSFGDLGQVDVMVRVRWLELPDETFTDLRRIIKELKALDTAPAESPDIDLDEDEGSE